MNFKSIIVASVIGLSLVFNFVQWGEVNRQAVMLDTQGQLLINLNAEHQQTLSQCEEIYKYAMYWKALVAKCATELENCRKNNIVH